MIQYINRWAKYNNTFISLMTNHFSIAIQIRWTFPSALVQVVVTRLLWNFAVIWSNAEILLIWPSGTNFSDIVINICVFSFKNVHFRLSSINWRSFRPVSHIIVISCYFTDICYLHMTPWQMGNVQVWLQVTYDVRYTGCIIYPCGYA